MRLAIWFSYVFMAGFLAGSAPGDWWWPTVLGVTGINTILSWYFMRKGWL